MDIRNIAIIAHVDHGKTTLVDGLLQQCNTFAAHEQVVDRVMDSMDLERERGITITSKNTAVFYEGTKINICDTPGHSDFGGEVERVLQMVDGAILLVDASEGCLPQTRFVVRKAMEAGLKMMVCINKIDRPDARIEEVSDEIYDLFIDLGADDDQIDFPLLYACARDGLAYNELGDDSDSLRPILDCILANVPISAAERDEPCPRMLVTNLDYDPYVGRLALGRLVGGTFKKNTGVTWFREEGSRPARVQFLYTWRGLKRHEVDEAEVGDIIAIAGIDDITVGDTVAIGENAAALPRITVDEPTIGMTFTINGGPLAGRDGKFLTSRQIRERLERELMTNVSLKMEETDAADSFKVFGRGELQLGILLEQMRREGFELCVSRPEVVKKEIDGEVFEPYERVLIDVPDEFVGQVTQRMADRKGEMLDLEQDGSGHARLTYKVPSRGLIGFRGQLLTATRGEAVVNTQFEGWFEDAGYIQGRANGCLIADRAGKTTAYSLFGLQPRGTLFVDVGVDVYEGMCVGINARENDLNVDATKAKQLTNFRAAGADEKTTIAPPLDMGLDRAIEFIDETEWVEITPNHIRIRKKILPANQRSIRRGEKAQK
ncbi:MAG: translational GTPase TypA [Deltaproteobacteria bacterium]|nr:MAG: translational GTPase TypA [Deltaproteobacteria bacterium]